MHARAEARKRLEPGAVTAGHAADRTAGSEFLAHANEKHGHVAVGALARAFDGHDRVAALLPWFGGGPALLVAQQAGLPASATAAANAQYCDHVTARVEELFL